MKIFISGPLTNDGQAKIDEMLSNVAEAIEIGIDLIKLGHYPFIPHLSFITHSVALEQGFEIPWQIWMDIDDAFLHECDAIFWFGSSKGSEIELSQAKDYGLKIFTSLDDVPKVGVKE